MRVSTLSGVMRIGGIAEAVWAAAMCGSASMAQTVTGARYLETSFILPIP